METREAEKASPKNKDANSREHGDRRGWQVAATLPHTGLREARLTAGPTLIKGASHHGGTGPASKTRATGKPRPPLESVRRRPRQAEGLLASDRYGIQKLMPSVCSGPAAIGDHTTVSGTTYGPADTAISRLAVNLPFYKIKNVPYEPR